MCYKNELEKEIALCRKRVEALYEKLKTKDLPTDEWYSTYSEIFAIQGSIESKKQRIDNMGKSFINPQTTPKNVTF
jgi:hypothetical protein